MATHLRADLIRSLIAVLASDGDPPDQIARALGVHPATVYRALRRAAGVRPRRQRVPQDDARALSVLLAELTNQGRAAMAAGDAPVADVNSDQSPAGPYADLADPDYLAVAGSAPDPEAAYARALLRKLLRQADDPALDPAERDRLPNRAATLLGAYARLRRESRLVPSGEGHSQLRALLDRVTRDKHPKPPDPSAMPAALLHDPIPIPRSPAAAEPPTPDARDPPDFSSDLPEPAPVDDPSPPADAPDTAPSHFDTEEPIP